MKIYKSVILLAVLQATHAMASPDIEVRKSVSNAFPMADEPVEFTIEARNTGDETALDVLIVDQLPAEMAIPAGMAAFTSIGNYDPVSGEWFIGDLLIGAGGTLVIPAMVTEPQPPQCIVNTAASVPGDIHVDNNQMRAAIYQAADYRCVDVGLFSNFTAGQSLFPACDSQQSYDGTVDVRNFGPDAAREVVVSLSQSPIIGAGIRFEDSRCEISGLNICTISEIPAGQRVAINVTSDAFQNFTDVSYQLAISVSTQDVDYVAENDVVALEPTVVGFSSCQAIAPTASVGSGSSGCFIATAAYGSTLDPRLDRLRDFRDRFLMTNGPGRAIVRFYYRNSPPIADFIAGRDRLRTVVRVLLTPIVLTLEYPIMAALITFALVATLVTRRRRRVESDT